MSTHAGWMMLGALLMLGCAATRSGQQRAGAGHGDQAEHEHRAEHHGHHHEHVHRFEDAEAWAARFNDPARDAWQRPDHVVDVLGLEAGMRVADIGTGTGYFLPYLSEAVGGGGRVLALDIEASMIDYVRQHMLPALPHANGEARVVAPDDPGLTPGSVDVALIVNTWHHIAQREAYARKLAASLAPGGCVAIVDYTLEAEDGPPPAMRLPATAVVAELEAGGLRAEVVAEELPRQYVVVGWLRE